MMQSRLLREISSKVSGLNTSVSNVQVTVAKSIAQNNATDSIIWPVQSHQYLEQIENLLRADDKNFKGALTTIFKKADRSSFNEFLRLNTRNLLLQAGRYTWTGHASNSAKNKGEIASEPASKLASIKLLQGSFNKILFKHLK